MKNPDVFLVLREDGYAEARGRLVTVDTAVEDGRVCVLFEGNDRPLLPLSETVAVELQGTSQAAPVGGSARVLQHRVGSGASFYVLELPQSCRAALASLFERRVSERVSPAVIAPIEASLSAMDGSLARGVVIKDLSSSGAGLLLQPPENLELLEQVSMRLAFSLPGETAALEMAVHLASRRPSDGDLLYGVAFDSPTTSEFMQARARIAEWVAARSSQHASRVTA